MAVLASLIVRVAAIRHALVGVVVGVVATAVVIVRVRAKDDVELVVLAAVREEPYSQLINVRYKGTTT